MNRYGNKFSGIAVVGLANDFFSAARAGHWLQLSPFGDFPHPRGIQRIDRAAADALVEDLTRQSIVEGRSWRGVPFFVGHPDVPELAHEYPNKTPYGWIKALEPRTDGIYGRVEWTEVGQKLIDAKAFKSLSPFWMAEEITENGLRILRPVSLKSVGFTDRPNLPVKGFSAANSNYESIQMNLTPKQIFEQIVTNLMAARKCSYQEAYNIAQLTNRELFAAVQAEGKTEQQRANELTRAAFKANAPAREERAERLREYIKQKMDEGSDYDAAWRLAQIELPELFAAMQAPTH